MDKDRVTPEEKLLKIIENPELSTRKRPAQDEIARKFNNLLARLKNLRLDIAAIRRVDVRTVNKAMAGLCAIITLFLIGYLLHDKLYFAKRFKNITAEPAASVAGREAAMNIDVKLDDVLAQAKKRNIFTLLPPKEKTFERADINGPVELKLVGVLWSDNPQAMIENTKEQKTYFVSAGDKIGVVIVKSILRNKVILGKDSEEWELR